jgi:single-strand DNA-binding protein
MNSVNLIGYLTANPEINYVNELAIVNFVVAINYGEFTDFIPCCCFKKTAENLKKYKKKGDLIAIEGRLKQERWTKDGKNYSAIKIIANNIIFLTKNEKGQKEVEVDF